MNSLQSGWWCWSHHADSKEIKIIPPAHPWNHTKTTPGLCASAPPKSFLHHSAYPQHTKRWDEDWKGFLSALMKALLSNEICIHQQTSITALQLWFWFIRTNTDFLYSISDIPVFGLLMPGWQTHTVPSHSRTSAILQVTGEKDIKPK